MDTIDKYLNCKPDKAENSDTKRSRLRTNLRILATTDLHMHLTSHDYYADRADPTVGLTRTASLIHAARIEAEKANVTTLLLDNGDSLQGTPMGEVASDKQYQPHPLMQAFAHLRYDAIGLGNHDFNFGLEVLDTILAQAPCPVVCSNFRRVGELDQTQPFTVLERTVCIDGSEFPIRIGVVSFLPSQILIWDAHLLEGRVEVDDILSSARQHQKLFRDKKCDLIIALAHTGLGSIKAQPGMENAAIPLASIDGIDVVIAGHTHLRLPGPDHHGLEHVDCETGTLHGKPAIMAGSAGTHLGIIDLELCRSANGGWKVANHLSTLRPIARNNRNGKTVSLAPEDTTLASLLAPHHDATRTHMRQHVGFSDLPRHSYFSFFAQDQAMTLVAAAQAAALRPMLANTEIANLPLLSAVAPSKFGDRAGPSYYTDVPAGPLSLRHLADLYTFPNMLHAVIINGAQVLEWLEASASLFHQILPGSKGQFLLDPAIAGYNFDVLHGLEYRIDLSVPARFRADGSLRNAKAQRIVSPQYQSQALRPEQKFVVALNNYRANGGGDVVALKRAHSLLIPRLSIRDALRDYVSGSKQNDPISSAPAPWKFSEMPGTFVTALTGPGALAHMSELEGHNVVETGLNADGFLTLRVAL
jgi:2',3'-cyclic-nucleotide 2'-phosphodiesterase / 3'-nucleotidase